MGRRRSTCLLCLTVIGFGAAPAETQESASHGEWRYYGGDRAFTRYSPLEQIDRYNVANLEIAWRRPATATRWTDEAFPELEPNHYLRSTPLMIDGVLYASNALGWATTGLAMTSANKAKRVFMRLP